MQPGSRHECVSMNEALTATACPYDAAAPRSPELLSACARNELHCCSARRAHHSSILRPRHVSDRQGPAQPVWVQQHVHCKSMTQHGTPITKNKTLLHLSRQYMPRVSTQHRHSEGMKPHARSPHLWLPLRRTVGGRNSALALPKSMSFKWPCTQQQHTRGRGDGNHRPEKMNINPK